VPTRCCGLAGRQDVQRCERAVADEVQPLWLADTGDSRRRNPFGLTIEKIHLWELILGLCARCGRMPGALADVS
jgi:hypothetical protein